MSYYIHMQYKIHQVFFINRRIKKSKIYCRRINYNSNFRLKPNQLDFNVVYNQLRKILNVLKNVLHKQHKNSTKLHMQLMKANGNFYSSIYENKFYYVLKNLLVVVKVLNNVHIKMMNVLLHLNNNWLKHNLLPKIPTENTMRYYFDINFQKKFFINNNYQVARRIAIMEVDLERAEDRAEAAEA